MRKLLLGLSLIVSTATLVHAQSTPPCDGAVARVRVSEIKPGMYNLFEKAVAANLAWYRGKGIKTNNVVLTKIFENDAATQSYKYSQTQAMTVHYNPPQAAGKQPAPDDSYKAFVKMYNDSSTMKQEYDVCMPKTFAPQ